MRRTIALVLLCIAMSCASARAQNVICSTASPASDSSNRCASTEFVQNAITFSLTGYAPLNSPHFTGIPTAPTAAPSTNTTQLATTAFVKSALKTLVVRVVTVAGAVTVTTADNVVVINKTVGQATVVNLPGSPGTGDSYTIKDGKGDAATNAITITPAAGTIDGASTLIVNLNYSAITLVYNGTEWSVV